MLFLSGTRKAGLLRSVHHGNPESLGAVLFPISLALCAALFWSRDPLIFQGVSLILGLADGLAGVVGEKFGRHTYQVTGPKSVEGSLTFFTITFVILLTLLLPFRGSLGLDDVVTIVVGAFLLTCVEGALSRGWDNLGVPLLGGIILYYLLF